MIELGSNDLVNGADIELISDKLLNLAQRYVDYKAEIVVIGGIIFRDDLKGRNSEIKALNALIKEKIQTHRFIIFHDHKYLGKQPIKKISRDGIHPNTALGRKLYIKSISAAVHTALSIYRRYSISTLVEVRIL